MVFRTGPDAILGAGRLPAFDVETLLEQAARSGFTEGGSSRRSPCRDGELRSCRQRLRPSTGPRSARQCAQYREPFLADNWSREANGQVVQRTTDLGYRDRPYVFLYTPKFLANCWGKTGKQIGEQFSAKGWRGLTVPEYLVLQRGRAERHADHRFVDDPEDPMAHWLWLIDSMTETDCTVAYGSVREHPTCRRPASGIANRSAERSPEVIVPLALG